MAVGRIDENGTPDVVIGYHGSIVVYRNASPGLEPIFSAEGGDPHGCAIGDVDLDGLGDVYCTRGARHGASITAANRLYIQTVPGTFEDKAAEYGVEDALGRGRRTTFMDLDGDAYPDLFVGNGFPRTDERRSPNRTFVDVDGSAFDEVFLGVTRERGARCVQAVDQDRDGREDLLLCGDDRLFLYRRSASGFHDVARREGIAIRGVTGARLADLNGDGRFDLVAVRHLALTVFPGLRGGAFGRPVLERALSWGSWVVVGNVDGRRRPDLYVVQSCRSGSTRDARDLLLVARPGEWRYASVPVPRPRTGCGDVAAPVDLNGDRRDEVIVLNGRDDTPGPVQVMTTGWRT